jgi:hypothetical protein
MLLPLVVSFIAMAGSQPGPLVCRYDPDRDGSQIVLRPDGCIRFVAESVKDSESVMCADIHRQTATQVYYQLVMVGRTDTFQVSLTTLRGTQRLTHSDGSSDVIFHLTCHR